MAENYVVVSKVKEFLKNKGFQTSATAVDALSNAVADLLNKAATRAKLNKRQTVQDKDI
ncbi:hypothetical protein KKA47_06730 [bacterium]|nr:hypothetical protein [bacterium]